MSRPEVIALLREWLSEANVLARERGLTPSAALGLALSVIETGGNDAAST